MLVSEIFYKMHLRPEYTVGLNHNVYTGRRPQSAFWPRASELLRARPYAGPTCTRRDEAQGPGSPSFKKGLQI